MVLFVIHIPIIVLRNFITQNIADFNVQCLENAMTIQIYYYDLQQIYQEIPQMEHFFRLLIQKAFVEKRHTFF